MSSPLGFRCAACALALVSGLNATNLMAQANESPPKPSEVSSPKKADAPGPTVLSLTKDVESLKQVMTVLQAEDYRLRQELKDREKLAGQHRAGVRRVSPMMARILVELDNLTVIEFIQAPLQDVVDYLKDYHRIEIQLDKKALDDAGVGSDTPITRNLRQITLRSALKLLLKEHDLDWTLKNEVLLITTRDAAEEYDDLRSYPVGDLVGPECTIENLAELVRVVLEHPRPKRPSAPAHLNAPTDEQAPPAAAPSPRTFVMPLRNVLVVRENQRRHESVEELLGQLRTAVLASAALSSAAEPKPEAKPAAPPKPPAAATPARR